MPNRLKIINYVFLLTLAFFLSGCVTVYNAATGKREALLIDTPSEVSLGRDMDKEMHKKLKILKGPGMQDRLNYIGAKVAGVSDRQDLAYYFRVVDDKEFNAFAIPGGYIYVNSGLMDAATDNELACVLGHEIGHIAARHSVKKLQAALGYQLVMSIALGISKQETAAQAMEIFFDLTSLSYSRADETLADKLAVRYAKSSGFDPYGMISFLRKLQKEAEEKGGRLHIELFSSHPDLEKRIENVEKEITHLP